VIKQLIRRLALALSLAVAAAGGQLAFVAIPVQAVQSGWPPILASGGICEDGDQELPSRCSVLFKFLEAPTRDLAVFLATRSGSALPDRDYLPPEREFVLVPGGAFEMEVAVWIVQDGWCEPPESFTLLLSTDDPTEVTVPVEIQIIDKACRIS
jgi:hypothetical protein